jgi:prevent-host-death family protein
MMSLSVSEFMVKYLAVLEDVEKHRKRVLITKRGKPIAEIVPCEGNQALVSLKDTVRFVGDIVSPRWLKKIEPIRPIRSSPPPPA